MRGPDVPGVEIVGERRNTLRALSEMSRGVHKRVRDVTKNRILTRVSLSLSLALSAPSA